MNLNNFSDAEQKTVLKFVEALVDGESSKSTTASFNIAMSDDESLAQAEQQARNLAARRKTSGGRMLVDDDETAAIRTNIRDWFKRTKRNLKYGIADENN
jgi:hypothetical protein